MNKLIGLIALLLATTGAAAAAPDLVPPEQAFRYQVQAGPELIEVRWTIEDGYYLYQHRFGFSSLTDGITLAEPRYQPGKMKTDEFFGESEIYRDTTTVQIPYKRTDNAPAVLQLEIRSQGCADIGLCYPPQRWQTSVELPAKTISAGPGTDLMALVTGNAAATAGDEFLPPEEAFFFTAQMADPYRVQVDFTVAPGYYLYRDKFSFATDSTLLQLGNPRLPPGVEKFDEHFGDVEVYYDSARIYVPISRAGPEAGDFEIDVGFQGCAEDGICYPPMQRTTAVILPVADTTPPPELAEPVAEQDRLALLIRDGSLGLVVLSFFGLGLLLAFTPCVFPMVPILSGIIVGQGPDVTSRRAFLLSLIYVLAMALTYTVAGVIAAMLGHNLQATFQHPGVIIVFSLVFIALALAMFGVYELQVPAALQNRLTEMSNRQSGGRLFGVGIMGVLSALIVGPCVAAPLVGALIYIGQSGDPVRGGLALFALSMGMGAPLLVFGASAGHLLPRAGAWMGAIRGAFGVMLLGVAIWMLSRIVPTTVTMLMWGSLALMTGVFMGALQPLGEQPTTRRKLAKGGGLLAVLYGILLFVGGAMGGADPLRPLHGTTLGAAAEKGPALVFERIKTVDDLERRVQLASAEGRSVMLDFYADWCVECIKLEKTTFHDTAVVAALADTVLLQADVTANDADDRALLNYFEVYGPPTVAFFGADGKERKNYRIVGYVNARDFEKTLSAALGKRDVSE
ncbi:MAG: protein-disulfide reductase DsbD [Gammaproteobacteria bacterium]|nr:protein-disulfide reductase DsbD [Gammaproteobacteria bacterium]